MKIKEECLSCLVRQAVRTAKLTKVENREGLYREIFAQMSRLDSSWTSPEVAGANYRLIKQYAGCDDPYRDTKEYYNRFFLDNMEIYEERIHSIEDAVKYAIIANIIDFSPAHSNVDEDIRRFFSEADSLAFTINDVDALIADIRKAGSILYIGDNCGEICFDKLLIQRIKGLNPQCRISFGVRGAAVMNDNTEEDAYFVGMDAYADIISNGDDLQGTVLSRTSLVFQEIYRKADVVIAKGQANYETLSEEEKNIYFLLMVKCRVIAEDIGAREKSLVCMRNRRSLQ